METLIRRSTKGSPLSAADHDTNMTRIENAVRQLETGASTGTFGITTYHQDAQPTGNIKVGSIWKTLAGLERRWNGTAWVLSGDSRITEITTQVNDPSVGLAATNTKVVQALSTLETIEGQLAVEWKLVLDTNGKITGIALRSGGGESEFMVQADRFVVVQSGPGGTPSAPFEIVDGIVYMKQALIRELSTDKLAAGDLKVNNLEASSRLYNATHPSRKFRGLEAAVMTPEQHTPPAVSHGYGSSPTAWGFNHHPPLRFYGQGHPTGGPIVNISGGEAKFGATGRLINHVGLVTVYWRRVPAPYTTPGPFTATIAWDGSGGGPHSVADNRTIYLSGLLPTDIIEWYVAPCNGSGVLASPVTCRYELDVQAYNWA